MPLRQTRISNRAAVARERAAIARKLLAECRLCAHDCGANRLSGPAGLCHASTQARVFSAQLEAGDELELIPTYAIAFSGCDLRCDFCITGHQSWDPGAGTICQAEAVARAAETALAQGARTVMFLGGEPTIHLPTALELVSFLPDEVTLVWKTNAHGSARARSLLAGLFDVWLADFKFGNDLCAERLARVPRYLRTVMDNLLWASAHSDLIVRHLLMPGHIECCWRPIAEWIADTLPGCKVALRREFWPGWHSAKHPELRRTTRPAEQEEARQIALDLGLALIE